VQLSGTFNNLREGRAFIEFTKRKRPQAPPSLQSCDGARANQPPPLPLRQAAEDAIRNSIKIQSLGISGGPATSARRRRQQQYKAVQRLHLDRSFPPVTFCHIFCWFFKIRGAILGGQPGQVAQHWNERLLSFCVALWIATAARTRAAATTPAHTLTVLHHVTRICL
jgi:hypothetical protein